MFATIVLMLSQIGMISTNSKTSVITRTAMPRRLPAKCCTRSISGHVAMTNVTAHMVAGRNGRSTQKVAAMRPPMNSTDSVERVRSWCGWDMAPIFVVTAMPLWRC